MRVFLVLVFAAASGCAKKSSTPAQVSPTAEPAVAEPNPDGRGYCYLAAQGMCLDLPADAAGPGEQLCADNHATWSRTGCPTEGVIGYCTNPEHGESARISFYAGEAFATAEDARAIKCSDEGDVFEAAD